MPSPRRMTGASSSRRGQLRRQREVVPFAVHSVARSSDRATGTPRPSVRRGWGRRERRRKAGGRRGHRASAPERWAGRAPWRAPLTVARPTRSPVKEPGPTDTARPCEIGGRQPAVGEQAVHGGQQTLRVGDGDVQRDLTEQAVTVQERGPARQRGALDGEELHDSKSLPCAPRASLALTSPRPRRHPRRP